MPDTARGDPARQPVAARRPTLLRSPHGTRSDDYAWLRDDERTDPDVLSYLREENAHHAAYFARLEPFAGALYAEILGRLCEDDTSVPVRERGYWYYGRYEKGSEYPLHVRRADRDGAAEELLLDENALAAGHEYYDLGDYEISDDNRLIAWTEDTIGRREYVLRVREIATGRELGPPVANVEDGIAWSADGCTVFYVAKDPVTLLGNRVRAHAPGGDPALDPCVYEERDESYYLGVHRGRSGEYLYIVSAATVSTEYRYAPARDWRSGFRLVRARARDHEYHVEDRRGEFLMLSNEGAPNFRVLAADAAEVTGVGGWRERVAHRDDVLITSLDAFDDFIVLGERARARHRLRILAEGEVPERVLDGDEDVGTTVCDDNPEPGTRRLRYAHTSPVAPLSTCEVDVVTGATTVLKVEPVIGGFDASRYVTRIVEAPARDGVRVPVTLLYRRDTPLDGTAPLYQYAYGAYGASSDATFSSARLSLVDRGFVYAIAHVRGGQELGRAWYDDGRLGHKAHSFDDFIDVTRFLVAARYVDPDRLFGMGASAGGLLVAAVANRAPGLYRALVAHVPFVDVLTSMQDESIPLTTNEYDEWGDPRRAADYAAIAAWSPYDNVAAQPYPALLVTAGLWDSQVQYWEPAKWVARLRALRTNDAPLLLKMDLEAGHGGKSGRYQRLRELAEEYAFVLDLAGITG